MSIRDDTEGDNDELGEGGESGVALELGKERTTHSNELYPPPLHGSGTCPTDMV